MELVLKHVVVGLAIGAGAALFLVCAGTVLLLSVVFGFWTTDDMLIVGGASGWCYGMAPLAGLAGFLCGVLGSLILRRVQRSAA